MLIPTSLLPAFTAAHVVISLAAIVAGFVVVLGMTVNRRLDRWAAIFLGTTVATSVTGFGFPIAGLTPGLVLGLVSLVVLATAIGARSYGRLAGRWRWAYVVGAVFALYLNVFVLIVQSFQKLAWLHDRAPTQSEGPFVATQGVCLTAFLILGTVAVTRFRPH